MVVVVRGTSGRRTDDADFKNTAEVNGSAYAALRARGNSRSGYIRSSMHLRPRAAHHSKLHLHRVQESS